MALISLVIIVHRFILYAGLILIKLTVRLG